MAGVLLPAVFSTVHSAAGGTGQACGRQVGGARGAAPTEEWRYVWTVQLRSYLGYIKISDSNCVRFLLRHILAIPASCKQALGFLSKGFLPPAAAISFTNNLHSGAWEDQCSSAAFTELQYCQAQPKPWLNLAGLRFRITFGVANRLTGFVLISSNFIPTEANMRCSYWVHTHD